MRITPKRGIAVAALMAAVGLLLGTMPADAAVAQRLDLDLVVLVRSAGTPQTGETWTGTALTLATGERWTMTATYGPWGNFGGTCGRVGTWQIDSVDHPGDRLGGGISAFQPVYSASSSQSAGRFAGLRSAATGPATLPILLKQLGGCSLSSFVGSVLPPLTTPLSAIRPVEILPVNAVTIQSPIAAGSLRLDLIPA